MTREDRTEESSAGNDFVTKANNKVHKRRMEEEESVTSHSYDDRMDVFPSVAYLVLLSPRMITCDIVG